MLIVLKYGRVVFSGWLFLVAYACHVGIMVAASWPPEAPSVLTTTLSSGALCLILWQLNRSRSTSIKNGHAFKLGLLRYVAAVLDIMERFYLETDALEGGRSATDDETRKAAARARAKTDDMLREEETKVIGLCYTGLPAYNNDTRDFLKFVDEAHMPVNYYEPDNARGKIYCAEKHLLEPLGSILGAKFLAADRDARVKEGLAAARVRVDKMAGRVNAWKAAMPPEAAS